MTDFTLADKSFPHLRGFAAFLLGNHLQKAAEANIEMARQVDLPLLKVFAHLSEPEFLAFVQENLQTFFTQLLEQTALEHAKETLRKWRSDTLPNIPRGGVATADLVLVYHVRKQLLMRFVDCYTTDLKEGLAIVRELDVFYSHVEQFAFSLFVDLKEEEHKAINNKLQEQQTELEEAYEELMASREELQQTNEKLREEARVRNAAEEALEKERNFLEAVLEHISDGIVACDESGVLSFFNKATRHFHGITEKALPPEQWSSYYNLYHGDGVTPLTKEDIPLFRAYKGEDVEGSEMVIAPVNGKKRLLLANGQPIISSRGEKLGAVVVMHDITDLKKAQKQQQEAMQKLQEVNNELATALEELQATEEQLLEANHELEERVAIRTKELAASEQQMRLITDALPVLISYVDADECYRYNNKAYEDWFNRSRAEIYGKKIVEVAGEAAYQHVQHQIASALRGETVYYDAKLDFKEAGLKDVSVTYIPHKIDEAVVGLFALVTDITERKKAEQEMKLFMTMCENSSDFIGIATPDGQAFYVNPAGRKMVGLGSLEEVKKTNVIDYFTEEDQVFAKEVILPTQEKEGRWIGEFRFRNFKTGQTIPVHYNQFLVKDPDTGQILGVATVSPDITERKQAEEALRESAERFRTFADNIQNLAWMAEPDGSIYWYNQRWYDYTGTSYEEMQGWGWEKVHHPDHVKSVTAFVKKAWQKAENWELTFPLRSANGEWGWFLTRVYAIKDLEGKIVRWIGTNTDVTQQVEARQQLEESEKAAQTLAEELAAANEELQAASEEIQASNDELHQTNQQLSHINSDLDNFIYTASHDLRAPISNIEGLMYAIMRNLPEETRQAPMIAKLSELITNSIERFKRTINDLTQITKIQREGTGEDIALLDFAQVIQEVRLDLASQIEQADAKFEVELLTCAPIHFSTKNARSIIYNLLSNAVKYRSPKRQLLIRVSCYSEGGFQVLSVADNGLGMDPSDESKIFAMFKRLHDHVEGSGVGLYIVKKIIENAQGKIEVESRVDQGSIFRVYFKQ